MWKAWWWQTKYHEGNKVAVASVWVVYISSSSQSGWRLVGVDGLFGLDYRLMMLFTHRCLIIIMMMTMMMVKPRTVRQIKSTRQPAEIIIH